MKEFESHFNKKKLKYDDSRQKVENIQYMHNKSQAFTVT